MRRSSHTRHPVNGAASSCCLERPRVPIMAKPVDRTMQSNAINSRSGSSVTPRANIFTTCKTEQISQFGIGEAARREVGISINSHLQGRQLQIVNKRILGFFHGL